jgi:hypothetical protein
MWLVGKAEAQALLHLVSRIILVTLTSLNSNNDFNEKML